MEATLRPDGRVEFRGQVFRTCSSAAEVARSTITGRKMSTNGWSFWKLAGGPGSVTTLEMVRAKYLESKSKGEAPPT
jgi:hypothetical protein